jgi:hypothetical protein
MILWRDQLNTRKVVPKELGKSVSTATDTKPVADSYYLGNESIIAFQG